MELVAIPPMTPPAMTPGWPPFEDGKGVVVKRVEDVYMLVEDVSAVYVLVEDVYTLLGPKIAPGAYSGLSISNVGVRP
jgi:hypothetical protein